MGPEAPVSGVRHRREVRPPPQPPNNDARATTISLLVVQHYASNVRLVVEPLRGLAVARRGEIRDERAGACRVERRYGLPCANLDEREVRRAR